MSRSLLLAVTLTLAAAGPVAAQEPPEALLSPTTQFYVRWDGIGPHKAAYQGSALGAVMAGPTGDSVKALIAKGPKLLGAALLAEPLLDGKPPADLWAVHADLKKAGRVLDLITDKGVVVAAEVAPPRPTPGGVARAVGGLLTGTTPPTDTFMPDVRVYVIVPDVGDRAEILFSSLRLLVRSNDQTTDPFPPALGRRGVRYVQKEKGGGDSTQVAWWVEGRHFVLYAGTTPVDAAVQGVRENAAKGGLAAHPLFQRCLKAGDFEAVARGYVDTGAVVTLAKQLAGPFVPGLAAKLDAIGLGNLKAVVFASGFRGKESRAFYDFDLPGPRQGLAAVLKPVPVTPADLPPLPPDVSRFSLLRIDFTALYEAGLTGLDTLAAGESFGVEDGAKTPAEATRLRKAYLERELTKAAGIDVRADLLPHLGDKVVIFQTPTEGLSVFGTVVCVSVKNPGKVRAAVDRLARTAEAVAGGPLKVRKKVLGGVELREVYGRGFVVLVPTYAVVGDWLVIAAHPQPVQGLILRHKGDLERWRPDAETAARLTRMPADAIGLQYCNPKSTVQNLCIIGPLFVTAAGLQLGGEGEFDPVDTGLVPNAHELGRHLFPNLTYTRDDGKTVRVEVNDSFSLPLEFAGLEVLVGATTLGGLVF